MDMHGQTTELDDLALSPAKWFFRVPSYRRLLLYIFLYAFLAGFLIHIRTLSVSDAFLFGTTAGIFILAVPALFSAVLVASISSRREFGGQLKYFLFTALTAEVIASLAYLAGGYLFGGGVASQQVVLLGNAVVFAVWFGALYVGFQKQSWKALLLAFLQPLFNLSLIVLYQAYGVLEPSIGVVGWLAVVKLAVASLVMLLALSAIFYLLNAPAKRNFGISTVTAATLFVAQWARGSKGLEGLLDEVGEKVNTSVGVAVFRVGGRIKAVMLVPHVHYGPLGNLGGSELPAILSADISRKLGAAAFVFHGTAEHGFNPVHAAQSQEVEDSLLEAVKTTGRKGDAKLQLVTCRAGDAKADGFCCPSGLFLTLSRAPKATDDINYPAGRALMNLVKSRYGNVVLVDRHNSKTNAGRRKWEVGSPQYEELEQCVGGLKTSGEGRLTLGVAQRPLDSFTVQQGIGRGGLKVAVLGAGGKKWCVAVIDANNILPEFRSRLLESVSGLGLQFIDVCTTDTHVVNTINGVHNPLGLSLDEGARAKLVKEFSQAVRQAASSMEPATVAVGTAPLKIKVLGAGKVGEVTSTINSIVAMAKIIAPIVFILALVLAFLALIAV